MYIFRSIKQFNKHLQAPASAYYIPNFVSEEEASYLWRQVGRHYDCMEVLCH